MQKITYKLKRTNLLFLFLFFQLSTVFSQDRNIEFIHQYNPDDNYIGAKSEVLEVNYKQTSPFVMLSGHTTNTTFIGTAYYRLKSNKIWGEWTAFPAPHEGEIIDKLPLGIVFIENAFEDIQFKVDKADNSKFVFRLFLPEHTKNLNRNKGEAISGKQLASGCAQPAYQGRNDWCPSGDCPKATNPSVINPTHIVVHHSAGETNSTDFAAVVRGYWSYHVNDRGWADIGYNWLVDPNGVLYEGRGDRIRGAHSPCMNAIATGICFIGNYEGGTQPSAAGLKTLKDFIAWDATDKGIDIKSSSMVSGLGIMDHLSGHKDGKDIYPSSTCTATACPGANLHNKISSMKNEVSGYSCYISSANAPKTPVSFTAVRKNATSVEIRIKDVANATKYGVYKSTDNVGFQKVLESASTTITIDNLNQGEVTYFKVEAINNDGVSDRSTVLASTPSLYNSDILIVDGIERRQFEGIQQYEYPLSQLGRTFSSATNDAVLDGMVNLNDFKFVIWMLLDESTADHTFTPAEQTKVKSYIDNGGVFIVSGNEIGWDLVHRGDATDQTFYKDVLKATYVADNPSPHNYKVKDNNNVSYDLSSDGSILNNAYPDAILPLSGASMTFTYDGYSPSTGVAGIGYKTTNGGVEYLAFAIEGIKDKDQRKDLLDYLLSKYSSLLSVDDSFIKQNIGLYPNPANGRIRILNPNNIQINKVDIFNIYGQKLHSELSNNSIDLSGLTPGVYLIRIEDKEGKPGSFKIIKN